MSNTGIIFVVGVGRSGTSLLQSMLSAHPEITFLPETAFFRRYVARPLLLTTEQVRRHEIISNRLVNDEKIRRLNVDIADLARKASKSHKTPALAAYEELLKSEHRADLVYVGDKDPRLVEFIPFLFSHFPGAHVINIIRDPRDVLVSKKNAAWSAKNHVFRHTLATRVQERLATADPSIRCIKNYHEIHYENLIATPDAVLSELCSALGLPYSEEMLAYQDSASQLVSKDELSWKKETLGPLLTKNMNKWTSKLTLKEVALTEICVPTLSESRYQKSDSFHNLTIRDKAWVLVGGMLVCTAGSIYEVLRKVHFYIWKALKK